MVQTETIRQQFAARLTEALNNAKYPPHGRGVMLAQRMGVTSKAVSKWLTGESLPRAATMKNIAKALNVDPLWLQHGDEANAGEERLAHALFRGSFPLMGWDEVINVTQFFEKGLDRFSYFYSGAVLGDAPAFWLVVKDDSMTSPAGPCVPENSMILIDTGRIPENGQLVVAKLASAKEVTFKQYIVDEGINRKYLKPLNTNYKPVEIDDSCKFIGVVIECRMSFVSPDPAQSLSVIPHT